MKTYHIAGVIKIYGTAKEIKELQEMIKFQYKIEKLNNTNNKQFNHVFECSSLLKNTTTIDNIFYSY